MKESFERLTAWAKEHPYIAGALVIGVVILAYITIKRGGGGGGFSGSMISADAASNNDAPLGSSDLSSLDASSGGGGSSGAGGSSDNNDMPSPVQMGEGSTSGGGNTNGGGFDSLENQPVDYASELPPATYAIASGVPVTSMQSNSLLSATASSGVKGSQPKQDTKPIQATASSGVKVSQPKQDTKPIQATASSGVKGSQPKQVTKPIQATASSGVKPATTKTHAELLGLYKYYTGTYKGIRYLLGWRVLSSTSTAGAKKAR